MTRYVPVFFALGNLFSWLKEASFPRLIHPPERMRAVLEVAGLVHVAGTLYGSATGIVVEEVLTDGGGHGGEN